MPFQILLGAVFRVAVVFVQRLPAQRGLALAFREEHTTYVDTYDEFKQVLADKGGFIYAHWDGTAETEQAIKEETKATIRLIPLDAPEEPGTCIYSGKPSKRRVVFAVAY